MHPFLKGLLIVATLAILIVVFRSQTRAEEQTGWKHYGTAEEQGFSLEALQTAREQGLGTSAEPWITYQLALKLQESGEGAQTERARQLIAEQLSKTPDHPTAERLRRLQQVLDSYARAA